MPVPMYRRQINPERDAQLTANFHRMLAGLQVPPRPVDGVSWNPVKHPIHWAGWPRVRLDVRFLEDNP